MKGTEGESKRKKMKKDINSLIHEKLDGFRAPNYCNMRDVLLLVVMTFSVLTSFSGHLYTNSQ